MAEQKTKATEQLLTMSQVEELMRKREALKSVNEFKIACQVLEIIKLDPTPKLDKKKQPILDDDGQPTFWDEAFWVVGATMGSEEGFMLSSIQVQNIEVGNTYLFTGRIKNRKVKPETITLI